VRKKSFGHGLSCVRELWGSSRFGILGMPEENLRATLNEHVDPCSAYVATTVAKGRQGRRMRHSTTPLSSRVLVSRDGIEPPTRGFSIPTSAALGRGRRGDPCRNSYPLVIFQRIALMRRSSTAEGSCCDSER
jgi:hypothetical protein